MQHTLGVDNGRERMRTKYFKNMFHNISQGVMYSAGTADSETKESWTACYLCGGKEKTDEEIGNVFSGYQDEVRLLAVGDGSETTTARLMEFVKKTRVEQVILPGKQEKTARELQKAGVKRVVEMKPGSSLYEKKDFWQFKIHCYGTEEESFLVMFTGETEIDWKTMDCLMCVRPFDRGMCCGPEIDMDNLVCCARCGLYNDYDVCKGHNQNTGKGYTVGALLLGNLPVSKYSEAIKTDFSDVRDQIRYISLTGDVKKADGLFSVWIGDSRKDLNHYYILPSGCADTGDFITEVLSSSGRNRVYLTKETCGVCGSGFFISKVQKNN